MHIAQDGYQISLEMSQAEAMEMISSLSAAMASQSRHKHFSYVQAVKQACTYTVDDKVFAGEFTLGLQAAYNS